MGWQKTNYIQKSHPVILFNENQVFFKYSYNIYISGIDRLIQ